LTRNPCLPNSWMPERVRHDSQSVIADRIESDDSQSVIAGLTRNPSRSA
jgi:hypothetical protein